MGLIDVLNGMQNGPRGPRTPSSESSSGGMSPITMAILGLLAFKTSEKLHGSVGDRPGKAGSVDAVGAKSGHDDRRRSR